MEPFPDNTPRPVQAFIPVGKDIKKLISRRIGGPGMPSNVMPAMQQQVLIC